jgi:hypothetical protein
LRCAACGPMPARRYTLDRTSEQDWATVERAIERHEQTDRHRIKTMVFLEDVEAVDDH